MPCWQWLANMTYPQLWKAMFKHSDIAEMPLGLEWVWVWIWDAWKCFLFAPEDVEASFCVFWICGSCFFCCPRKGLGLHQP